MAKVNEGFIPEGLEEDPIHLDPRYAKALKEKVSDYESRLRSQRDQRADPGDTLDTECKLIAATLALRDDQRGVTYGEYLGELEAKLSSQQWSLSGMRYKSDTHNLVRQDAFQVVRDYAQTGGQSVRNGTGFGVGKFK